MNSVFFNTEVLIAEKKIIESINIPSIVLMENAGLNSARIIKNYAILNNISRILILAGKGNNAGDGFVIARHLSNFNNFNVNVGLVYPASELKGDTFINYSVIKNIKNNNFFITSVKEIKAYCKAASSEKTLIIDSVFGVGFKGTLDKHCIEIFNIIKERRHSVISIDTASGLNSYYDIPDCPDAKVTISMGVKKFNSMFGEGREKSGKIEIVDIGISGKEFDKFNIRKIFEIEKSDVENLFPPRKRNSHKYNNGKVFVLGGYPGFSGAPYLSSQAALRTGSGAVILGVPKSIYNVVAKKTNEVITIPLKSTISGGISEEAYEDIKEKIVWSDVTLIGPGIGREVETQNLIRKILTEIKANYVVDADGIFALRNDLNILKNSKSEIILTPHYGEFAALSKLKPDEVKYKFYELAKTFSKDYEVTLHLKNSPSVTATEDLFLINSTGKENLATIGSGDVLSGIISTCFALTKDAAKSTYGGAYMHGLCGDNLFEKYGSSSTTALDLINEIKNVKLMLNIG